MPGDAGPRFGGCLHYGLIGVLRHPMSLPSRPVSPSFCPTLLPKMRFYGQTSQLTAPISLPRRLCRFSWLAFWLLFSLILTAPVYVPWKTPQWLPRKTHFRKPQRSGGVERQGHALGQERLRRKNPSCVEGVIRKLQFSSRFGVGSVCAPTRRPCGSSPQLS